MSKVKFSIVIPVYNAELYLNRCIDSVLHQTYDNYEIILIDDGSIDNSLKICEDYASNNSKIKLNSIKNHGVSYARNMGIKQATGDYITFLDSDDWVEENYLSSISKCIEKKDYDVIQTNLFLDSSGKSEKVYDLEESFEAQKFEVLEAILSVKYAQKKYHNRYLNPRCAAAKFYKKTFFTENQITYPEGIKAFEDGIFNLHCYYYANNILIEKDAFYHYVYNVTSATEKYYDDQEEQNQLILTKIREFLNSISYDLESGYDYTVFELYYVWIDKLIRLDKQRNFFQKKKELKRILGIEIYKKIIVNIDRKYMSKIYLLVWIFSYCRCFLLLYLLFKSKGVIKSRWRK